MPWCLQRKVFPVCVTGLLVPMAPPGPGLICSPGFRVSIKRGALNNSWFHPLVGQSIGISVFQFCGQFFTVLQVAETRLPRPLKTIKLKKLKNLTKLDKLVKLNGHKTHRPVKDRNPSIFIGIGISVFPVFQFSDPILFFMPPPHSLIGSYSRYVLQSR
jgi:hypothetical protein